MIKKLYINENNKRVVKEGESYGWTVGSSEAWDAYDMACDYFGKDYIADQIASYIGTETLSEALAYIFRQHDFSQWKNRNNEDEEFYESKKSFTRFTKENYENDEDWFVIDDTRESRFYDNESLDDVNRLAQFYCNHHNVFNNSLIKLIQKDLTRSGHSEAFIAEVIAHTNSLMAEGTADPYDLALYYFDQSLTDKEIENDLIKQGYSSDFIMQVFDHIDEFSS